MCELLFFLVSNFLLLLWCLLGQGSMLRHTTHNLVLLAASTLHNARNKGSLQGMPKTDPLLPERGREGEQASCSCKKKKHVSPQRSQRRKFLLCIFSFFHTPFDTRQTVFVRTQQRQAHTHQITWRLCIDAELRVMRGVAIADLPPPSDPSCISRSKPRLA